MVIKVQAVSYTYAAKEQIRFPDFALQKGEYGLLLGESGSGKTSLLHLVGGLLRGYHGSIMVNGTELSTLRETQLDHFRAKHMGFIFQRNHLITALNVERNIHLAPYLAGLPIKSEAVNQVLADLNLKEKRTAGVTALSQGQAQRVAIARAVINNPSIILADEPTSALDDKHCYQVIDLLMRVATEHQATLLVATHDQRLKDKIPNQIQLVH